MHYLIFLPDVNDAQAPGRLEAVGLADHAVGAEYLYSDVGPDGKQGTICAWRKPGDGSDMCYNTERQTWVPAAAEQRFDSDSNQWVPDEAGGKTGRYYVGFNNESPPRSSELKRAYPYAGRVMTLGDQPWTIPAPKELPHDLIQADDGGMKFEVQRRFHDWFLECQQWIDFIASHNVSTGMSYQDMWYFSIKALRLNYRITPEVVSHMRLFDQNNIIETVFSSVGLMDLADEKATL